MRLLALGFVVLAAAGGGWLFFRGAPAGTVTVGHSLRECNEGGRDALDPRDKFWSLARFESPIPGEVYEVRISRAGAAGALEQVTSWSVKRKLETQDTVYFGGKPVLKVTRGHTGPMHYGLYVGDDLLAERRFEVGPE